MGGAAIPPTPRWLFRIPALELTGYWVGPGLGAKIVASGRAHLNEYFPVYPPPVSLSSHWTTATPCLPRSSPRPAGKPGPGSYEVMALALGPRAHKTLCVPFKSEVFVFCSPMEFLWSSPPGPQSQRLWGFLFPMPVLQDRKPDIELRILTPVGELLWYNNSLVYGERLPTHGVWDWLIILQVYPSYHLIGFLLYVFGCRISSLIGSSLFSLVVVQHFVWFGCSHRRWVQGPSTLPCCPSSKILKFT